MECQLEQKIICRENWNLLIELAGLFIVMFSVGVLLCKCDIVTLVFLCGLCLTRRTSLTHHGPINYLPANFTEAPVGKNFLHPLDCFAINLRLRQEAPSLKISGERRQRDRILTDTHAKYVPVATESRLRHPSFPRLGSKTLHPTSTEEGFPRR